MDLSTRPGYISEQRRYHGNHGLCERHAYKNGIDQCLPHPDHVNLLMITRSTHPSHIVTEFLVLVGLETPRGVPKC